MLVDPALNSPLESMGKRRHDRIAAEDVLRGRSHLGVNGEDMVMHASNGMLHPALVVGSTSTEDEGCNVHFVDATSVHGFDSSNSDQFGSTKMQEHQFVHVDGMPNGGDSVMGGVTLSGNGNGSGEDAVQCGISDNETETATIWVSEMEAEPWPKWKRLPDDAPEQRPARLMGAIERDLCNSSTRKTKYIFEPTPGMTFDCVVEPQEFYEIYSWEVGFGTKKGDKYRNSMQEFQCQCQGSNTRVQYKTKKKKCQVMLQLHRTTDFGWYVSLHRAEHNHSLFESYSEKLCWNSHGKIQQSTKNMIRNLRDNNVTLTKVNRIISSMIGHGGEPPRSSNSIANLCNRIAKEQKDDDVRKTLEVFEELKKQDPGFQCSVDYDKVKNKLKILMWCTGRSRSQYACFGDVVTFDTTYCTNIYKMPFGIFVGVNNHFLSIIFAGVLMTNEKSDSFE
uniref:Protein FAR1-RELATED SEQUENCE n=1 Tax=Setaria viridis TaxID=4556 RepID=A0A4U6TK02_SETVI|nr:hypothetical protein SEVIR_8G169500v2 [Setaria viridis]TKW01274.1 hypothetical protein SEVIR_8G169500v2 [Setaria viridis]